jgi:hypothetical protein
MHDDDVDDEVDKVCVCVVVAPAYLLSIGWYRRILPTDQSCPAALPAAHTHPRPTRARIPPHLLHPLRLLPSP